VASSEYEDTLRVNRAFHFEAKISSIEVENCAWTWNKVPIVKDMAIDVVRDLYGKKTKAPKAFQRFHDYDDPDLITGTRVC
jgi:hypothetical protein